MSTIGTRLAEEIERLGGVTTVAAQIRTVRNTIYNWIQKENIPANKLAEIKKLGGDPIYILTGQRFIKNDLQPREIALIDNYRNCNEKDKRIIEQVALSAKEPEENDQDCIQEERKHA